MATKKTPTKKRASKKDQGRQVVERANPGGQAVRKSASKKTIRAARSADTKRGRVAPETAVGRGLKKASPRQATEFLAELRGRPLTFGDALAALRHAQGESLAQFAKRLGISRSHLNDVEKGNKCVSLARAVRFAKALRHSERTFVKLALRDQLRDEGLSYDIELIAEIG